MYQFLDVPGIFQLHDPYPYCYAVGEVPIVFEFFDAVPLSLSCTGRDGSAPTVLQR